MPQTNLIRDEISQSGFLFSVFLVVLFSWVLIDLWGRWFNNFTFNSIGLNPKSSYDTFIIALFSTLVIIACIVYLKTLGVPFEETTEQSYAPTHTENYSDYMLWGVESNMKVDRLDFLNSF